MTNKYALGLRETNTDTILFIVVDAPDNKSFFTAVAETLEVNRTDLSVSDVLSDLKETFKVLGVSPKWPHEPVPDVDHAVHVYDEANRTVSIYNDEGYVNVTFQLNTWLNRYGLGSKDADDGVPVL